MHTCSMHVCIYTYICTNIYTYMHAYTHTYIRTYVRTYVRMYVCTYLHKCIHTYIYHILGNFRGTKFSRMGPFREQIFEDGHLVINDNNETSVFRAVKISRLQANPQKQRKYFTSKISQNMVLTHICTYIQHTYMHTYIHTCIHTYIRIYMHIVTYIHTHRDVQILDFTNIQVLLLNIAILISTYIMNKQQNWYLYSILENGGTTRIIATLHT